MFARVLGFIYPQIPKIEFINSNNTEEFELIVKNIHDTIFDYIVPSDDMLDITEDETLEISYIDTTINTNESFSTIEKRLINLYGEEIKPYISMATTVEDLLLLEAEQKGDKN